MTDDHEAIKKKIIARKVQLSLSENKVTRLKESIIVELQQIFPQYIERQLISIVEYNANIINETPAEKLDEFKKAVSVAKEKAIKRVIDELSKSEEWFSCEKGGIDIGGGLWSIIKSVEKEFLPSFSELRLKSKGLTVYGSSDLTPLNLGVFQSDELKRLNEELTKNLEDYCGKADNLKKLQNNIAKKKALERWENS